MSPVEAFDWLEVIVAYTAYILGAIVAIGFIYAIFYEWRATTK